MIIQYPNPAMTFEFEPICIFESVQPSEMILLGKHKEGEKEYLELLGVTMARKREGWEVWFYGIKAETQKKLEKLIDLPIGKKVKLRSDIRSSFWTEVVFTKVPPVNVFESLDKVPGKYHIMKTPKGFMTFGR